MGPIQKKSVELSKRKSSWEQFSMGKGHPSSLSLVLFATKMIFWLLLKLAP